MRRPRAGFEKHGWPEFPILSGGQSTRKVLSGLLFGVEELARDRCERLARNISRVATRRTLEEKATDSRGQSLVEFALVAVVLVMLLLGVVEVGRLVVVYTAMANAAKEGARFAAVHGSDSASPATVSSIQTAVQTFLGAAPLDASKATISANWPDSNCTNPGCHVTVTVSYSYDPLVSYYRWTNIQLGSTSEGVITW